jgi:hypothetical protein
VNRRLRVLILGQIVTQAFQGKLDVAWPHKFGRRRFQDGSDFIGQRGLLKQVRSLRAWSKLDALAFAQCGQCLKRLAHQDDPPLRFLLFGQKIGQLLLGGLVRLLIFGGMRHAGHYKQA